MKHQCKMLNNLMKIAMNEFSIKVLITVGLCIFGSCKSEVELKTFSPAYQLLLSPFSTKQIEIFSCGEKTDTIIFYPVEEQLIKMRHLERGFYDMYIKSVEYELTSGSFHKFPQSPKALFLSLANKSSNDRTSVSLNFLGLIFDGDGVDIEVKNSNLTLSDSTALHTFININECIKSFIFDKEKGVIEFTDCSGNKWNRK